MRIALCSKGNFSLEKGFTKNRLELAEALEKLGWEPFLVDKQVLGIPADQKYDPDRHSEALKEFLLENASDFDVVLYEYDTLPFERELFCADTLFIARPAILAYHFQSVKFRYDLKARVSRLISRIYSDLSGRDQSGEYLQKVDYCLRQADLIQVQNKKDYDLLQRKGFPIEKMIVVPNGITDERLKSFSATIPVVEEPMTLAFVGSFDFRKGAIDLVKLFRSVKRQHAEARLKLLGTKGMFQTEEEVSRFFPKKLRSSIEVVPAFKADELPRLLKGAHIGIFPSYLESFGFGALEMMAAGLPVVAYDVPGPSDFILPELLVRRGDQQELISRVLMLINGKSLLKKKSEEARQVVRDRFTWSDIATRVDRIYRQQLDFKREKEFVRKTKVTQVI